MPRFHFHLRAPGKMHSDTVGTDLPDLAAAREHARAVAHELVRGSDVSPRHGSLRVENASGEHALDLFFADVDPRLAAYSPEMRLLVAETSRRLGALTDAICALRATRIESRILIARARSKPQLAFTRRP